MKSHYRHHTEEYIICAQCGKQYSHDKAFRKHMNFHKEGKELSCHVCLKKFENNANKRAHMSTHALSPMFQCPLDICKALLRHESEFNRHLRGVHKMDPKGSNLKPIVLDVEFQTRRDYLIQTGEMPPLDDDEDDDNGNGDNGDNGDNV